MTPVKLHLDMADREMFEPCTTVSASADTSDVAFFYAPFGRQIRVARLLHNGRELVLYSAKDEALPWSKGFAAVIADMGKVSWSEAVERGFEGVSLDAKGKAFVELDS